MRCHEDSGHECPKKPRSLFALGMPAAMVLALAALVTAATLGWLLNISRYGIDLTDESFYLIWMSDPSRYKVSAFLFGFVYYPLYKLVGGDIALLRQSNIALTFCLAWVLGICFFRAIHKGSAEPSRGLTLPVAGLAAAVSSSSLVFLSVYWLPTPNYNTLALQALLLAGIGLLLAEKAKSSLSVLGWLLVGVAGWLAFMAKPTTAAALGLASCFYLVFARKLNLTLLAVSALVGVCLLLTSAFAIDGSIEAFVQRLTGGIEAAKKLGAGHTFSQMLRLDSFHLRSRDKLLMSVLAVAVFASTYFLLSAKKTRATALAMAIPVLFSIISLGLIIGILSMSTNPDQFQGLLTLAIPLVAASLAITQIGSSIFEIKRENWAIALAFGLFPYIFAFGTATNYWESASSAAIFWVLSGFALLATTNYPAKSKLCIFLPATAAVQLITVILLYVGMHNPYRQSQPLPLNNRLTSIGATNSRLVLSPDLADYLGQVRKAAFSTGFRAGTPMIDLTGHYPGTLYALGATILGEVWAAGGYRGSNSFATTGLDREPCTEISAAWILTEPSGPRTLSPAIMSRYGIDLDRDYQVAGVVSSPTGAYPKSYQQYLLRPSRPPAVASLACEQARTMAR